MYFDPVYLLITAVFAVFSIVVSQVLKGKFRRYSKIAFRSRLSGKEIAESMLAHYGIQDVVVTCTPGVLTDHYNPSNKTVNLSREVFEGRNVSAAAVSAHECGHAVQHAEGYAWLQIRSAMVPMVSVSSNLSQWLILGGLVLMGSTGFGMYAAVAGLILYAIATSFSFITLPVEYDASRRALHWLEEARIGSPEECGAAKDALKWAARTYVVAALGALATLLHLAFRILGSRD